MSPSKYKENYPDDWEEIAALVKESNDYVCQMCGQQCTRPGEPYDRRRILTVAHLFHWPTRFEHVNIYGKYEFNLEDARQRSGLRELRRPDELNP